MKPEQQRLFGMTALGLAAAVGIASIGKSGQTAVTNKQPTDQARVTFVHSIIDPTIVNNGHKPKVIGDFAGRGVADVAALTLGKGIYLYEYPNWTKHLISTEGHEGEDARVADVDGDGDLDIIIGGIGGPLLWLENPLKQGGDPYSSTWKTHKIADIDCHDVEVGDINKDGKVDIATNGGLVLQNGLDSWTVIGSPQIERGAEGTALGNLIHDGYLDLIAPGNSKPYQLVWFENPLHSHGDPVHDTWIPHVIGPGFDQMSIAVADLNHDGRPDVIMAPMYQQGGLSWFEAPADPRKGVWKQHLIDPTVNNVHQGSIQIVDMDGDGTPDLVIAEQEQSPTKRIAVYYNVKGNGSLWRRQILAATGGHNLKVGRIARDKRPSILNANHGFYGAPNPIELWRNEGGTKAAGAEPIR